MKKIPIGIDDFKKYEKIAITTLIKLILLKKLEKM